MPVALLVGGTLLLFLYALGKSVEAQEPETQVVYTGINFNGDVIAMGSPDRKALLKALGTGIARGEGYFRTGTKPNRLNNPGDIKVGGTIATFNFDTADSPRAGGGWMALFHQLDIVLNGSSGYYDLNMSIYDMCRAWTADNDPSPELTGYVATVVEALNQAGYPATEGTQLGALARGDFSA